MSHILAFSDSSSVYLYGMHPYYLGNVLAQVPLRELVFKDLPESTLSEGRYSI